MTSSSNYDWLIHHAYLIIAAPSVAGQFVETFKDFARPLPFSDGPGHAPGLLIKLAIVGSWSSSPSG